MAEHAFTASVMTVSDRCSRGEAVDTSGPAIVEYCQETLGFETENGGCVPDEIEAIEALLRERVAQGADLLLTTGGTGLGPRDNTPEAAMRVIDRPHPQLLELARARCLAAAPRAYLSRGVSGLAGRSLIVTLPGSKRGALETLGAVADVLPHALAMIRGGDHPR
ncbi:hypothetical protein MNBD_PLANCTO03-761 [hydrothermal vent metagenome]|uniref:MoaB/Mog domain-containing protein n=1 Tax=hydrothermal vent metagenome TaxID=652676 RepID=A0A3B1D0H4_9ZZZZ